MTALLPRIVSLLLVWGGDLSRTRNFVPDYTYTDQFLDLQSFDEVVIVNVDPPNSDPLPFSNFVSRISPLCFLPMTIGGGITSVDAASDMFELGADRIVVGSALFSNPTVIPEMVRLWGSQAVVGGVSILRVGDSLQAVSSRTPDVPEVPAESAVLRLQDLGVGEILLTSVDRDGSLSGFDLEALTILSHRVQVPLILAGGAGNWDHLAEGLASHGASGVATSNIYHLSPSAIESAKSHLSERGLAVRKPRFNIYGDAW
jgi:cyclase